jgi:hypothetical protein
MWTNGSSKFGITNTSISSYYYVAFEINVVVASNYSFSTESKINTYGYIYNNTFHPDNPSLNLLKEDGNSGGNGQFKLTVFLQPWISYILVVTTSSYNATDRFLIVASGPTTVALRHIRKYNFLLTGEFSFFIRISLRSHYLSRFIDLKPLIET